MAGDDATTSFLGDLNIVAVPKAATAGPSSNGNKKRKSNKYERRRQKAKKAREQKEKLHCHETERTMRQVDDGDGNENDSTVAVDSSTHISSERQSDDVNVAETSATTTTSSNLKDIGNIDDDPLQQQRQQQRRRQNPNHNQDHAEYLAEFHARPMELDRRSGARATTSTVVSKASKHLFEDVDDDDNANGHAFDCDISDDNNADDRNNKKTLKKRPQNTKYTTWESLGLHPRLVQTLQGKPEKVDLTTTISNNINSFRLERPTTIQAKAIRTILSSSSSDSNSHYGIQCETGSGKTLAFLLPILQIIAHGKGRGEGMPSSPLSGKRPSRSEMGCRCIILCPTRELASQTLDVVEKICRANFAGWIVPGGLLGGDSRQAEKSRLRKGLGIIVATPGRLLDHLVKTQSLAMSLKGGKLHWLVLDECDRLLDMGLGDQIRQIVQIIRANDGGSAKKLSWKSVVVSATITPSVKALATERMLCGDQDWLWIKGVREIKKKDDVTGSALESSSNAHPESDELKSGFGDEDKGAYSESTPRQLTQFHLTVTAKLRLATLVAFLVQRIQKGERTVVFMGTCASVDYHYALFQAMEESIWNSEKEDDHDESAKTKPGLFGTKAQLFKLHGNVPHAKRHQTMKQFNVATCNSYDRKVPPAVLLTTDVAARGLNLEAIDWTVQYDPPCEINDYVHRAGRTARAGKAGHSLLFLLPSEQNYLEVLKAKGVTTLTPLSLSSLLNHAATVCTTVTQDGMYQQGGGEVKMQKRENDTSGHFDVLKSARRGEYFASEVQRRLEDCVVQDDVESRKQWKEAIKQQRKRKQHNSDSSALLRKKEGQLLELARDAFLSFLRAYPTKREPAVRSIFSSRSLHLGHVAKSFALKDPPKSLAAKGKSKRQQLEEESRDEQSNLPRSLAFSQSVGEGIDNIQQRILNEIPIISDVGGDEDYDHARDTSKKRRKSDRDGRQLNAKQMLLENAFKMQSNLMDAM